MIIIITIITTITIAIIKGRRGEGWDFTTIVSTFWLTLSVQFLIPAGRGREEKVKETGQKTTRPPQPLDHMGGMCHRPYTHGVHGATCMHTVAMYSYTTLTGHSGGQATVQPTKSSQWACAQLLFLYHKHVSQWVSAQWYFSSTNMSR